MGEPHVERRRFPRVRVRAPLFARVRPKSQALGAGGVVDGRLLDVSRGGLAFTAVDPLTVGDIVELAVERQDRVGILAHVDARVVGVQQDTGEDVIVRCAFAEPVADEHWIERIIESVPTPD
jgi:stage V sporulation protein SpoVS